MGMTLQTPTKTPGFYLIKKQISFSPFDSDRKATMQIRKDALLCVNNL